MTSLGGATAYAPSAAVSSLVNFSQIAPLLYRRLPPTLPTYHAVSYGRGSAAPSAPPIADTRNLPAATAVQSCLKIYPSTAAVELAPPAVRGAVLPTIHQDTREKLLGYREILLTLGTYQIPP